VGFCGSPDFAGHKYSTRVVWRRILDQMREKYGDALTTDLRTPHINKDLARIPRSCAI